MNHKQIIAKLRINADVFKHLFQSVSDERARWKPTKKRWSILEVISHLYDEERSAFCLFNQNGEARIVGLFRVGIDKKLE